MTVGDLREPESLARACIDVEVVISTASAFSRARAGETGLSIDVVDRRGHESLIKAAESAGVDRFVFLSLARRLAGFASPLARAKRHVERRLEDSSMRAVIVRSELFQESALSARGRFDWQRRTVAIPGRGLAGTAYVAADDVAELLVRLALEDDPPQVVEIGGPQPISRREAAAALEKALGEPVRVVTVPRPMLRIVISLTSRVRPATASEFALVLAADLADSVANDAAIRERGTRPRSVSEYISGLVAQAAD